MRNKFLFLLSGYGGHYYCWAILISEIILKDQHGNPYTLEFNRETVERMQRSGGSGCFIHHYPPEAEGFRPVYLFGPLRERFSGMGKMAAVQGDPAFAFCHALIDGYLRSNVQ